MKTGNTITEGKDRIIVGGRGFLVPPFSLRTYIKISSLISELPAVKGITLEGEESVLEAIKMSLSIAKDCSKVVDILAYMVYGSKFTVVRRYLFKLWAQHLTPEEIFSAIITILNKNNVAGFFQYITFLTEVNLLKPTKVI